MKYLLIILILITANPLFSYCKSNKKNECLKFKQSTEPDNTKTESEFKDIYIDNSENKYLLLNIKNSLKIKKLNNKNVLQWQTEIDANGVNIYGNGKSEIYIIAFYTQDLNPEINNKKNILKSNNTQSLLVLKLNSKTGKITNHFNISTNYGIVPAVTEYKYNNLYIAGYYGGKSEILKKNGYEDAFILILDENLQKVWSKTINQNNFLTITMLKVSKNNIYYKTNERKFYKTDKKNKHTTEILKNLNIKTFDIDENENIYAVTNNNSLKKFDNNLKPVKTNSLNEFDYSVTPSEIKVVKNSLFIKYSAGIDYRYNIIISKYNSDLKNIWHYAIIGTTSINASAKFTNKKVYLFGEYTGNLELSDKNKFYSSKIKNFLLEFEE